MAAANRCPDFGQGVTIPYLLGVAKVNGKVTMLLDIDHVLGETAVLRELPDMAREPS